MDIKRGKVIFIDDESVAVRPYIQHLREEGFTNVDFRRDVGALNETLALAADVIFLDITGVAAALDANDEGLAVLDYVKDHAPWTRVVVLSGSAFPASKAKRLSRADSCITKASLTLADLVKVTETELGIALSPEYRNLRILNIVDEKIDSLNLGWYTKWKLRCLIKGARRNEGNHNYDWAKVGARAQMLLSGVANMAQIVSLFLV